ncbi:Oligophrenin-1 [Manis javanica]|nr:Oligophrenin-1 [Manis javanica]
MTTRTMAISAATLFIKRTNTKKRYCFEERTGGSPGKLQLEIISEIRSVYNDIQREMAGQVGVREECPFQCEPLGITLKTSSSRHCGGTTIEVAVGVHHRGGSSGCPASPVPDPAAVC